VKRPRGDAGPRGWGRRRLHVRWRSWPFAPDHESARPDL